MTNINIKTIIFYIEGLRVLRGLRQLAIALLLVYLVITVALPATRAELELRSEVRSGDILFNNEIIADPFQQTLFHTQDAARTDTEALSIAPATANLGLSIAQTADVTTTGSETGFFNVFPFPYVLPYAAVPGYVIGDTPSWVSRVGPIGVAGLPANTAMIFPDMTLVKRGIGQSIPGTGQANLSSQTGNRTANASLPAGSDYAVDANASKPYLPGNLMQVTTAKNEKGQNETVIDRTPQPYQQIYATPEELANKTIIDRMWRDVHLNFNLDRAYSGETCNPDVICPLKNPLTLMPWYPTTLTVADALKMTRQGAHLKKIMWPVGA